MVCDSWETHHSRLTAAARVSSKPYGRAFTLTVSLGRVPVVTVNHMCYLSLCLLTTWNAKAIFL